MAKFIFREITGDLFSAPKTFSLGHCVASDLKMGKGIAVKFRWVKRRNIHDFRRCTNSICLHFNRHRDTFGRLYELKNQAAKTGGVAVLKDDQRFIYYLVTKTFTYQKPTYGDMHFSLTATKEHMVKCSIIVWKSLSFIQENLPKFRFRRWPTALQNWRYPVSDAVWTAWFGTKLRHKFMKFLMVNRLKLLYIIILRVPSDLNLMLYC